MKSNLKRMLAILLACLVMSAAFSGCGSSTGSSEAILMNGWTINMDEMKLYAYTLQDKIEESYAWMIYYYGETYDSFWKGDSGDGTSMWEENLTFAVQQIIQTKILAAYAQEHNITLDDAESIRVCNNIDSYRTAHANAAKFSGATDELIRRYYTENALAYKAALDLQKDVSTDFDYETFRRKRIVGVSVTAKSTVPTTTADPSAETTTQEFSKIETTAAPTETYAEDEKKTAREEALKEIEERMKNGEKPEDIVELYKDDARVTVATITTFASSSADEVAEGEEKTSHKNYAWALSTGEVTAVEIANSNSTAATIIGYVLRCEDDDDAEYRKSAEDTELENRKTAMFQEKYQELLKQVTGLHVYTNQISAQVSYKGQTTEETTAAPTEAPTTVEETTTAEEASTSPQGN